MLNRKLLSLLISLLLTLTPFASFDVAAAIAGNGHCMMMDMDGSSAVDSQSMTNCVHCNDDSCGDNTCTSHGCSAGQSLSLIHTAELPVQDHSTVKPVAIASTGQQSRNAPPLLRPPV